MVLLFHDLFPAVKISSLKKKKIALFVCIAQFVVPFVLIVAFIFLYPLYPPCVVHTSRLLLCCRLAFTVALIEFLDSRPGLKTLHER